MTRVFAVVVTNGLGLYSDDVEIDSIWYSEEMASNHADDLNEESTYYNIQVCQFELRGQ